MHSFPEHQNETRLGVPHKEEDGISLYTLNNLTFQDSH